VIFLGSILTFIVISALIEGASLENIAFGRKIISTGTNVLTLPGMWVLAITGVWMGYKRYGLKQRYFQIKLLLITLVVINAYFFIVPAATSATEIAVRSLAQGQLLPPFSFPPLFSSWANWRPRHARLTAFERMLNFP
jgi:hypothetical protein